MIRIIIDGLQSAVEFIGPHSGCEIALQVVRLHGTAKLSIPFFTMALLWKMGVAVDYLSRW